jgi:serine/threonine protein kinase
MFTGKLLLEYNKDYDLLKFNDIKDVKKNLKNEIILYTNEINKINKNGWSQTRNILISNSAIYNYEKTDLKRRIDVKTVKGVTASSESDEFIVHCRDIDHDYYYTSIYKKKIIQFLNDAFYYENNNYLPVCVVDKESLKSFVTLKTEKKKDITFSKMPNERTHVELYLYGKLKNLEEKSDVTKSSILDFKQISIIGRGSYAKIILAEHLPTDTLYALKALRKDYILDNFLTENLITEQKILTNIESSFVMNTVCTFQTKERIYFVMPFIKGGDLYQLLQKEKFLDEEK